MSIFTDVKERLDLKSVAECYGVKNSKNDMIRCLIHDDRTPSMKLYHDHYYCFGCGSHGDVIHFTAKLFGISNYEAAQKLSSDFSIDGNVCIVSADESSYFNRCKQEKLTELETWMTMLNYLDKLTKWQNEYKPITSFEKLSPQFIESLLKLDYVKYLMDEYLEMDLEERLKFTEEFKETLSEMTKAVEDDKLSLVA